jgi:hypothetical protein
MGDKRGAYRVLVVRPECIRQLGRPRRRWENNFKIVLQKLILGGMGWTYLVQNKDGWRTLVIAVVKPQVL